MNIFAQAANATTEPTSTTAYNVTEGNGSNAVTYYFSNIEDALNYAKAQVSNSTYTVEEVLLGLNNRRLEMTIRGAGAIVTLGVSAPSDPKKGHGFEINGHRYYATYSISETKAVKELAVATIKDAAGTVVAKAKSGKGFDTAFKSAKRKTELYACELVSSPAQSVSDADMVLAAIPTPREAVAKERKEAGKSLFKAKRLGDSMDIELAENRVYRANMSKVLVSLLWNGVRREVVGISGKWGFDTTVVILVEGERVSLTQREIESEPGFFSDEVSSFKFEDFDQQVATPKSDLHGVAYTAEGVAEDGDIVRGPKTLFRVGNYEYNPRTAAGTLGAWLTAEQLRDRIKELDSLFKGRGQYVFRITVSEYEIAALPGYANFWNQHVTDVRRDPYSESLLLDLCKKP